MHPKFVYSLFLAMIVAEGFTYYLSLSRFHSYFLGVFAYGLAIFLAGKYL
jgi:hypothetical protein